MTAVRCMLIKTLGPQIKRTHERRIGAVEPVLQRCCTVQVLLPVRVIQAAVICADHKHKLCSFLAVSGGGRFVGQYDDRSAERDQIIWRGLV